MKNIFLIGIKSFGKIVLANLLCVITVISITFLVSALTTENIGYYAIGTKEGSSEPEILYEYYYADGEDTKLAEYEEKGYIVEQRGIRSEVSASGEAAFLIIGALFTLSLAGTIIYSYIWKEGNKDLNLIRFGRAKLDKFKGVKIGLVSMSPCILFLITVFVGKNSFAKGLPVILFKYLNASMFSVIDIVCGDAVYFSDLAIWRYILLLFVLLLVPVFFGIAYYVGYKDILISDKLIYKKNKN